jgi:hypothetical protein
VVIVLLPGAVCTTNVNAFVAGEAKVRYEFGNGEDSRAEFPRTSLGFGGRKRVNDNRTIVRASGCYLTANRLPLAEPFDFRLMSEPSGALRPWMFGSIPCKEGHVEPSDHDLGPRRGLRGGWCHQLSRDPLRRDHGGSSTVPTAGSPGALDRCEARGRVRTSLPTTGVGAARHGWP